MTPALHAILHAFRHRGSNERQLQIALAAHLNDHHVTYEREARLSGRDRVDFLAYGVAIECKVDGAVSAIARQLARYATHPGVVSIALITTRSRHAAEMPRAIDGTRVDVYVLLALP